MIMGLGAPAAARIASLAGASSVPPTSCRADNPMIC